MTKYRKFKPFEYKGFTVSRPGNKVAVMAESLEDDGTFVFVAANKTKAKEQIDSILESRENPPQQQGTSSITSVIVTVALVAFMAIGVLLDINRNG